MLSNSELELLISLQEQLQNVYAFLIDRDNKNILNTLNDLNSVTFTNDSRETFVINKDRIKDSIQFSLFVIQAEYKHKKKY